MVGEGSKRALQRGEVSDDRRPVQKRGEKSMVSARRRTRRKEQKEGGEVVPYSRRNHEMQG